MNVDQETKNIEFIKEAGNTIKSLVLSGSFIIFECDIYEPEFQKYISAILKMFCRPTEQQKAMKLLEAVQGNNEEDSLGAFAKANEAYQNFLLSIWPSNEGGFFPK